MFRQSRANVSPAVERPAGAEHSASNLGDVGSSARACRWHQAYDVAGLKLGLAALVLITSSVSAETSSMASTTVLYLDRVVEVERTLADPSDLWVSPDDLTRINDFVLKPEGACLDDLCVPVNQEASSDIVVQRDNETWFSVTAFAKLMQQEYVVDHATKTWSFASIPVTRSSFLQQAKAPNFTLPDRQGNMVSLDQFLGRKVMILSWASW